MRVRALLRLVAIFGAILLGLGIVTFAPFLFLWLVGSGLLAGR